VGGSAVEVRGLTWRPATRRQSVLRDLDLTVEPGQRVLLAGPSGAGKSTLLRAIAGLLQTADVGEQSGQVLVDGIDPQSRPGQVALLLQDPSASIVAERIGRDVAFGLENLRVSRGDVWPRVEEALAAVGLPYPLDHPTHALSGGEMQRLALAGALAIEPGVLLLDEPASMLDPVLAAEVRASVADVVRRRGSTLVVVEHRIEPWLGLVDRLVVLDERAQVVADGDPRVLLSEHGSALAARGVWVPGVADPRPLAIEHDLAAPHAPAAGSGVPLVETVDVVVRHRQRVGGGRTTVTTALAGVAQDLCAGRLVALTGPSGAGKSTLVGVLGGLVRPASGTVSALGEKAPPWKWPSSRLARSFAWAPQQPEHGIVASTILEEVLSTARATGRLDWARPRAEALLERLGLSGLAHAHPYRVSGGEQRRVMVAAALAHGPSVLLLDEPTVGQDRLTWSAVIGACAAARDAGLAVAMATHDSLAVDAVADHRVTLSAGRVA
jgi:energy-coupling factor transport system ATP-binding protein